MISIKGNLDSTYTDLTLALLRDAKKRGMQAPVVAVGDGALGFWAAIREVFPETQEQRCWVHKIANVLDKLPKSIQAKLHEMMGAPTRAECEQHIQSFIEEYRAKYPKAASSLESERDKSLTHVSFPAEQRAPAPCPSGRKVHRRSTS